MPSGKLTLLLKGGTVFDGTGAEPYEADIGVLGDTIAFVGEGPEDAEKVIELRGLAVSPGFIDTHGHSEFTVLADPSAQGKVLQGITTEINGNCGLSAAPLMGKARQRREEDLREFGISERWEGLDEYFSILEQLPLGLNFATLAGHGSIRGSVVGYDDREPTARETGQMMALLEETLRAGAMGMSSGLIYPPGIYTGTKELVGLCRHGAEVKGGRFIYATHMRSEAGGLLEALEEAVAIGSEAGVRTHISHLKTAGRENWRLADSAISIMEEARAGGLELSCDRYPYTASSTELDSVLPGWMFEGGNEEEIRRLKDPVTRARVSRELPVDEDTWEAVVISSVFNDQGLVGKSVADIARGRGKGIHDALMDMLVDENLRVGAIFHGMSEENLWKFLSLPYAMVGSDSASRSLSGPTARGRPHPRGFGTFPRFLRLYPGGLGEAVYKVTGLPSRTFGLADRGRIQRGLKADLVAFEPGKLGDRATYMEPFLKPEGIHLVVINGVISVSNGEPTGAMPGRALRA